jgi:hypothetical protein
MTIGKKILRDVERILTFCESVTGIFCEKKIVTWNTSKGCNKKAQAQQSLSIFG